MSGRVIGSIEEDEITNFVIRRRFLLLVRKMFHIISGFLEGNLGLFSSLLYARKELVEGRDFGVNGLRNSSRVWVES